MFLYVVWMNNISPNLSLYKSCYETYEIVMARIKRSSHFRNLSRLGPPLIYMILKTHSISITTESMLELFEMDRFEFLSLMQGAFQYYPEYHGRNKTDLIKRKIERVKNHFSLPETFNHLCTNLFKGYYPLLQYTKEDPDFL